MIHRHLITSSLLGMILAASGCASHYYASGDFTDSWPQSSTFDAGRANLSTGIPGSIAGGDGSPFPQDHALISNDAVRELLAGKVSLPSDATIAVVQLTGAYYGRWGSSAVHRKTRENDENLALALKKSPKIKAVRIIPSIMLPPRQTLPALREVAARCQADYLLIYGARQDSYHRSKFLAGDQASSYCEVEAALVDIRTGVVPFTTSAAEDFKVAENRNDYAFAETLSNAQAAALGRALQTVAVKTVEFLGD